MRQVAPLFSLGRTVATPAALVAMGEVGANPLGLLLRHVRGDWAELDTEDQQANRDALRHGSRVFSRYTVRGERFWVITEADRAVTTVMLPSDY